MGKIFFLSQLICPAIFQENCRAYENWTENLSPLRQIFPVAEKGLGYIPGKVGQALYFDSYDDTLSYFTKHTFSIDQGTIELWLQHDLDAGDVENYEMLFVVGGFSWQANSFWMRREKSGVRGAGGVSFVIVDKDGETAHVSHPDTSTWRRGEWHHLAITWQGVNGGTPVRLAMFADGLGPGKSKGEKEAKKVHSNFKTLNFEKTPELMHFSFAAQKKAWAQHYHGAMDEVRISNHAKSDEEILLSYHQGLSGKKLNGNAGETFFLAHFDGQTAAASPLLGLDKKMVFSDAVALEVNTDKSFYQPNEQIIITIDIGAKAFLEDISAIIKIVDSSDACLSTEKKVLGKLNPAQIKSEQITWNCRKNSSGFYHAVVAVEEKGKQVVCARSQFGLAGYFCDTLKALRERILKAKENANREKAVSLTRAYSFLKRAEEDVNIDDYEHARQAAEKCRKLLDNL